MSVLDCCTRHSLQGEPTALHLYKRTLFAIAIRFYGAVGSCQPPLKPCLRARASHLLQQVVVDISALCPPPLPLPAGRGRDEGNNSKKIFSPSARAGGHSPPCNPPPAGETRPPCTHSSQIDSVSGFRHTGHRIPGHRTHVRRKVSGGTEAESKVADVGRIIATVRRTQIDRLIVPAAPE